MNPDTVFVGGIDVFRSDDGGATFGYANYGPNRVSMHTDQHVFAFHPGYDGKVNQVLFMGNDGGVFRTDSALGKAASGQFPFCGANPGTTGISWHTLVQNFGATQLYDGTILPGGAAYFGGSQDNGTSIGNKASGVNGWTYLFGGDGGRVFVDPVDPTSMFYEYVNLSLRKSSDGGATSAVSVKGVTEPSTNFNFINWYASDPGDPLKMYMGKAVMAQSGWSTELDRCKRASPCFSGRHIGGSRRSGRPEHRVLRNQPGGPHLPEFERSFF